ncbi:hypothetical protein C8T65DRAFT_741326 [Cerioporus squamosus]|nr:hypothetical protein C8T65DRAFT_741326 [Cerioporus squamosus]
MAYSGRRLFVQSGLDEERGSFTRGPGRSDSQDSYRLAEQALPAGRQEDAGGSVSATPTPSPIGTPGAVQLLPPATIYFQNLQVQEEYEEHQKEIQEIAEHFESNRLALQQICQQFARDLQEIRAKICRCRAEQSAIYKVFRQVQWSAAREGTH